MEFGRFADPRPSVSLPLVGPSFRACETASNEFQNKQSLLCIPEYLLYVGNEDSDGVKNLSCVGQSV